MNTLRKGRYITLSQGFSQFVMKIKNSKIVLLPKINFDIFNIPVECIEIDTKDILYLNNINMDAIKISIEKLGNLMENNTQSPFIFSNEKLYCELSKVRFSNSNEIKIYNKLRAQKKI